ncbi:MAG: hypothetical protein ABFS43_09650 [Thermodesulfobacteriota bacterium]
MKKLFVIFAAIAMVGAFAATTMAADWSFYGSSRMATFYDMVGEEQTTTGDSETTMTWAQQGNSRIGARVKASDTISGRFEYGFGGDKGISDRLLYGTWAFSDSGSLLLGQAYTPVSLWVGSQAYASDAGLIGWGASYGSRKDQIRLNIAGFQLALIENPGAGGYDTLIPKLEARYDLGLGDHNIAFAGGYNSQEDNALDESVDSIFYGIGYTGAFGPVWLNAAFHGGTNLTNAGWYGSGANAATAGGDDTTTMAVAFAVGMAASETMQFQAGAGYIADENEDIGPETDEAMSAYLQMTYVFAPGFFVIPEVGIVDNMEDMNENDQGSTTYVGAKWQINF